MNIWDCADPYLETLQRSDSGAEDAGYHAPVMPDEVVAFLRPAPGMMILDGTAGGGGHTRLFLEAGAGVLACDQDADAVAQCAADLSPYAHLLHLAHANFADAGVVMDSLGLDVLDGALLDLGVSSHQLDTATRGFSFRNEGPLDMRMDQRGSMNAAVLVNTEEPASLARIFREYGDEPRAWQIAARIAEVREAEPLRTTLDLARVVESVIRRTGPRHPATRVFQALRIAVNDELGALTRGLEVISERLAPGARFAVLTFHSLEDRIVKRFFRDRSAEWIDRPEWPEPRRNPSRIFRLLTPRPIDASNEEVENNPRSRSAKLRVAEKI